MATYESFAPNFHAFVETWQTQHNSFEKTEFNGHVLLQIIQDKTVYMVDVNSQLETCTGIYM